MEPSTEPSECFESSSEFRKVHSESSFIPQNCHQDNEHRPIPTPKPTWIGLRRLLERYPETACEVEETVLALKTLYPWYPDLQINFPEGPWPEEKPYFVKKSHLIEERENFQMAVTNITKTGKVLTCSDEQYLQYILCHWFGWSATSPPHHNDSWSQYIKHQYPHIENLSPILDDMTWTEEVGRYPSGMFPGDPRCFLLANRTAFYFYHRDPEYLMRAGTTLEEVYWGLREGRWLYGEPNEWEIESDSGEEYDTTDYFPIWKGGHEEGPEWVLAYPILPFIPYTKISDIDN